MQQMLFKLFFTQDEATYDMDSQTQINQSDGSSNTNQPIRLILKQELVPVRKYTFTNLQKKM